MLGAHCAGAANCLEVRYCQPGRLLRMVYWTRLVGRVIAGLPSLYGCGLRLQPASRRPTGRKVRTPCLWRITPQTKGNAPGNARGRSLPAVRESEGEDLATDSATENKPPVSCTSVVI